MLNFYLVVVVVRVLVKSVMLGEHVEVSNSTAGGSGMCDGISVGERGRFAISIQLVFIEHLTMILFRVTLTRMLS